MRTKYSLSLLVCLALLVSCSKKQSDSDQPPPSRSAIKVDPSTASSIHGRVKFDGRLPSPQKIDMTQDPACGNKPNHDESIVVNSGALQNVFVYVKSGLNGGGGMRDEPVTIKQQGCRYEPHVLGAMVDQRIDIINADETTHNIHPMPTASKPWNESQLPKAMPIVKRFAKPELMIPIKCNQHPWMRMYLNVVEHPFFAVSKQDGTFEISGLPPGEYTIAAVHEKLGEQEMKINVGQKENKAVDFAFHAR